MTFTIITKLVRLSTQVSAATAWKNWKADVKPETGWLPRRCNLSELIKDSWWRALPLLALTTCAHALTLALLHCVQLKAWTIQNEDLESWHFHSAPLIESHWYVCSITDIFIAICSPKSAVYVFYFLQKTKYFCPLWYRWGCKCFVWIIEKYKSQKKLISHPSSHSSS